MAKFTLLPNWTREHKPAGLHEDNLNMQDKWPKDWRPRNVKDIHSYAFPSPYGNAEAIALSIVLGEENYLPKHYKEAVLGLTLGMFDFHLVDLKNKSGDFGKALLKVEKTMPYLGVLKRKIKAENEPIIFAATHPRAFLWPHARSEEGNRKSEWDSLEHVISSHENLNNALQLLAEFMKVFMSVDGEIEKKTPWIYGLKKLIPDEIKASSDLELLRNHCRFIGPFSLVVSKKKTINVYWPVYHENFTRDFMKSITGNYNEDKTINSLRLENTRNETWATISLPEVGQDTFLLAGGGIVSPAGNAPEWKIDTFHLHDAPDKKGFFSYIAPLYGSCKFKLEADKVRQSPILYPDPIRILVDKLGEIGLPGKTNQVSLSPTLVNKIIHSKGGMPDIKNLNDDNSDNPKGCVIEVTDKQAQKIDVVYLDEFENVEICDLRALGLILWETFIGNATIEVYHSGGSELQAKSDTGSEDMVEIKESHPILPKDTYYQKVMGDAGNELRQRTAKRLATLQRFLRTYETAIPRIEGSNEWTKLLAKSAKAFAMWVYPGLKPSGDISKNRDNWMELDISGGIKIVVCKDHLA